MRRVFAVATLTSALTLLAGPIAFAEPTASTAGTRCDGVAGVTVVIDYGGIDGRDTVQLGCASGPQVTGIAALEDIAAITTVFDGQFVCTIDNAPADGDCENAGYWAFFTAPAIDASEWTASELGAGATEPAPGSVEGWVWTPISTDPNAMPTPPRISLGEVAAAPADVAQSATPTASASESSYPKPSETAPVGPEVNGAMIGLVVLLVVILVGIAYIAVGRSRSRQDQPTEQTTPAEPTEPASPTEPAKPTDD